MKLKMSFGEGGFMGFLSRHCEKIVFGIAVLLVIFVALPDSGRTPIQDNQGPQQLEQQAQGTIAKLDQETWPIIKELRFAQPDNYLERGEKGVVPVAVSGYPAEIPFNKPLFRSQGKRRDPRLYPVRNLEVTVSYGPVAEAAKDAADPLAAATDDGEDVRTLPVEIRNRLPNHVNLGGVDRGPRGTSTGITTKAYYVVAIKGIVPVKDQTQEYLSLLKDAAEHSEMRDRPNYGGAIDAEWGPKYYAVQRAEVSHDGTVGEWKEVGTSWWSPWYQQKKWAGMSVAAIADPAYVDSRFTMPVPPLMLRNLEPLALHSQVPKERPEGAPLPGEGDDEPVEDEGPPMGLGVGPKPDDGEGRPPAVRPRPPRGGRAGMEGEGFRGAGNAVPETVDPMFRFFDLTAEPGKAYVYRVEMYLEDPNSPNPDATYPAPPDRVLDAGVLQRLARKQENTWWRNTGWSDPSPVVRIPDTDKILAGKVDPPKIIEKRGSPIRIVQGEHVAHVMALVWDKKKAMDVPGHVPAARGTVLNFNKNVEAIDPEKMALKKLENYSFKTDNVVLDIRGGLEVGGAPAPGEILIMDEDGNLRIRSEMLDMPLFQLHDYPEAPKDAAPITGGRGEEDESGGRTRPSSGIDITGEGGRKR